MDNAEAERDSHEQNSQEWNDWNNIYNEHQYEYSMACGDEMYYEDLLTNTPCTCQQQDNPQDDPQDNPQDNP